MKYPLFARIVGAGDWGFLSLYLNNSLHGYGGMLVLNFFSVVLVPVPFKSSNKLRVCLFRV